MQRHLFAGEDPVATATRNETRETRRNAAIAEDSARLRAAHAAGCDSRSIGVTRRAARDDTDEM